MVHTLVPWDLHPAFWGAVLGWEPSPGRQLPGWLAPSSRGQLGGPGVGVRQWDWELGGPLQLGYPQTPAHRMLAQGQPSLGRQQRHWPPVVPSIYIKPQIQFVTPATSQEHKSHAWLLAAILDSVDTAQIQHRRSVARQ